MGEFQIFVEELVKSYIMEKKEGDIFIHAPKHEIEGMVQDRPHTVGSNSKTAFFMGRIVHFIDRVHRYKR